MDVEKRRFTDFFDLLEVDRDATKEDVQKAFMLKASVWHPDKAENDKDREHYTKIYQDLQAAYKILSNDNSRKQYIDSQQTTDMEFLRAERDVGYGVTDQFRTDTGKFDKDAFQAAFEQTRDQKEMEALEKLESKYKTNEVVTDGDLQSMIARRDADLLAIKEETEQVFEAGPDFDSDTFNRAFDFMKERSPGKGVQLYEGDPMAMFSGGGLEECDPMSGINFRNGTDFTGQNMDNMVLGQSINPGASDLDLSSLRTGGQYGQEEKLTNDEIQRRMAQAQADRENLATMDRSQFICEPSEIETLYSDLFRPMEVEGLEAPIGAGGMEAEGAGTGDEAQPQAQAQAQSAPVSKIRKKIQSKSLPKPKPKMKTKAKANE